MDFCVITLLLISVRIFPNLHALYSFVKYILHKIYINLDKHWKIHKI